MHEEQDKRGEEEDINREAARRNILRNGSLGSLREWAIRADVRMFNMNEHLKSLNRDLCGNGKPGLKEAFIEHRAEVRSSVRTALVILGSLGGINAVIALINLLGK